MNSLYFCYWTFGLTLIYLLFLLYQKRYRLLLPSVVHTFIWLITILLIIFHLKGIWISRPAGDHIYRLVSEFICYMIISSIAGFVLAHSFTSNYETNSQVRIIDISVINELLVRFRWIPYLCGGIGVILFVYLISVIGNINSLGDYRILAITTERIGYAAIAQRISGHITILGCFYLMILGYKYGITGIKLKEFFKYAILCSAINMSIGGRVWILTSTLPFIIMYIFSRKYSHSNSECNHNDNKKLYMILIIFISAFGIIGVLRSNNNVESSFIDRFLYFTDGSRMTNMVLSKYPPGSFPLEYGKSEFLSTFVQSPMAKKFNESIASDIGLSVTVKSGMPYLYYDFGYWGGIIMWGVFCFLIEYWAIRLKYIPHVIGLFLEGTLSMMLFQAPIGCVFSLYTPTFEWIILIYLFRKWIFCNIPNIKLYL